MGQDPHPSPNSSLNPSYSYQVSGSDLWHWQQQTKKEAIAHHIAPTEVDWFLQALSDLERLALRLESFKTRSVIPLTLSFEALQSRWQQRIEGRLPVQYLVGQTSWRQFTLTVSPVVLIPRPETELLIDLAIAAAEDNPTLCTGRWVDLGTGSGAIALGLADAFPNAEIHAVDCSQEALAIAQQNAQLNGWNRDGNSDQHSAKQIHFHHGHWFSPFQTTVDPQPLKFNGIVSNPPYIPSALIPDLQPEVTRHEPHLALDGGNDGLDCIRHLIAMAPHYLVSNGLLLIELMAGQADTVVTMLEQSNGYHRIQRHTDLAGIHRFVSAYRG